jgi:nucleotide-binding universal stress UspA family protein
MRAINASLAQVRATQCGSLRYVRTCTGRASRRHAHSGGSCANYASTIAGIPSENTENSPDNVAEVRAAAEAAALEQLRTLIPPHASDYCSVEAAVVEGAASRQILRRAEARKTDLIVLGVHGRNAFDLAFFGSNSKHVIRQARCPVLIVPAVKRGALRAAS